MNKKKKEEKKAEESSVLHNIASHLSQNMQKPSESPSDLIKNQVKNNAFNRMQNTKVVADGDSIKTDGASTKKDSLELNKPSGQVYPLKLGGYTLPLVGIPTVDMTSILALILCLESDHNPRIKKLLEEAKFQMKDMNDKQIFPRKEKKKKRARSKKR